MHHELQYTHNITPFLKIGLKEEYKKVSISLDLAILVRKKRDKLGMTTKKFAEYLEVSESTIKNIEAGTMTVPANLVNKIVNITR